MTRPMSTSARARDLRPWPELRSAREACGLSLHALGAILGVRDVTVWRWETGRMRPREQQAAAIRDALGVMLPTD